MCGVVNTLEFKFIVKPKIRTGVGTVCYLILDNPLWLGYCDPRGTSAGLLNGYHEMDTHCIGGGQAKLMVRSLKEW